MAKGRDYLDAIKHEIEMWEEGVLYEEEALLAISVLVDERLRTLGCPGYEKEVK